MGEWGYNGPLRKQLQPGTMIKIHQSQLTIQLHMVTHNHSTVSPDEDLQYHWIKCHNPHLQETKLINIFSYYMYMYLIKYVYCDLIHPNTKSARYILFRCFISSIIMLQNKKNLKSLLCCFGQKYSKGIDSIKNSTNQVHLTLALSCCC